MSKMHENNNVGGFSRLLAPWMLPPPSETVPHSTALPSLLLQPCVRCQQPLTLCGNGPKGKTSSPLACKCSVFVSLCSAIDSSVAFTCPAEHSASRHPGHGADLVSQSAKKKKRRLTLTCRLNLPDIGQGGSVRRRAGFYGMTMWGKMRAWPLDLMLWIQLVLWGLDDSLHGSFITLKWDLLPHYACTDADPTLTAQFVRRSSNALVICAVRQEHQERHDCTTTGSIILATMRWRCYRRGFSWGGTKKRFSVRGGRSAARDASLLVDWGQCEGRGDGGHEEGGTRQDRCASRPKHQPTVQGLHRPEGPHHLLPILEFELRERLQLEEHKINPNVTNQNVESDPGSV